MKLHWHSLVIFALLGSRCQSLHTRTRETADHRDGGNIAQHATANTFQAVGDAAIINIVSAPFIPAPVQVQDFSQSGRLLDVVRKVFFLRQWRPSKINQSRHHHEQHNVNKSPAGSAVADVSHEAWEQAAKVRKRQVSTVTVTTGPSPTSAETSTTSASGNNNGSSSGNCSGNGNGNSGNNNGDVNCTNVGNSGASDSSSGGLSRDNKIAIGIGVGGGCLTLISVIIAYNQCRRSKRQEKRAKKEERAKARSVGYEMHGGVVAGDA